MKTYNPPTNNYEALVLSLTLAITAPTDEKAWECARIAEGLIQHLTPEEVPQAQAEANYATL